ncbi:HIT family protein [Rossellomorea vietnamensis]|uniref:HIT family hydrolase n=1 Tax=Rossellomorea vietnamensis TaxID=218284 RepID=A0A0P6W565_9BACI|nr:HIT family protein [Rossellomorea vietnamensis]KPL60094.1 HIT family hydrolase [Rossellomorea vietnamensis]
MKNCLGCRLANDEENVYIIYENEHVTCLLDHDPHHAGHTLILPKKHKEEVTELDEEESLSVMRASQLVARTIHALFEPNGVTICQNGGIYNELTHYHMHVIPRNEESDQFGAMFYGHAQVDEPSESLEETHEKMKTYITRLLE